VENKIYSISPTTTGGNASNELITIIREFFNLKLFNEINEDIVMDIIDAIITAVTETKIDNKTI
tara:strand:+ start:279 stop:470 length:192 start_codon:yes stop_codon:yes gene_type:complete